MPRSRASGAAPALAAGLFVALGFTAALGGLMGGASLSDILIYQRYGEQILGGAVPYRDVEVEYPPLAVALFLPPALVTSGEHEYLLLFAAQMAIFGAAAIIMLGRALDALGVQRPAVRLFLVALSPLALYGTVFSRFDLAPACIVVLALLLFLRGRERAGFLALGAGIATKLYPAVILPLAAIWVWRRRGRAAAIRHTVAALAVPAVLYAAFAVVSPGGVADSLWRQLGRPLQIESLGAGILLALHHVASLDLGVEFSRGSHNLVSPAADVLGVATTLLQLAAFAFVYVVFARGEPSTERLVRAAAASVTAFVAFGKVGSPQFMIWLVFLVPLVVGARFRVVAACTAIACVLTGMWFPHRYFDLVPGLEAYPSWLVFARGLFVAAAFLAIMETARSPVGSRSRVPLPGRS